MSSSLRWKCLNLSLITNHPSTAKGYQSHYKVILVALSVKSSSFSMLQSLTIVLLMMLTMTFQHAAPDRTKNAH